MINVEKLPPTKSERQVQSLFGCVNQLIGGILTLLSIWGGIALGSRFGGVGTAAGVIVGMAAGIFWGTELSFKFGPTLTNHIFRVWKARSEEQSQPPT